MLKNNLSKTVGQLFEKSGAVCRKKQGNLSKTAIRLFGSGKLLSVG